MCLCIPSKIIELYPDSTALVDTMGVRKQVSTHLLTESLAEGDYLLIHVGFAISKIDEQDARASLREYQNLMEEMGEEEIKAMLV
ncbi:HypC/HybG/HupF family hydrogenase formation chaperone [Endozoicomonas sp. Mp262]|uniref:HypC/HybG/HupF family hydrogenase formation chaperone n=1 Tax=Endozoicomonas sp. Mp262 TaxID=2919499 RepID=UPI0021D9426E